ncbi:hypothetical protein OSTOST_09996, partial [Ostertagia ostertagi]
MPRMELGDVRVLDANGRTGAAPAEGGGRAVGAVAARAGAALLAVARRCARARHPARRHGPHLHRRAGPERGRQDRRRHHRGRHGLAVQPARAGHRQRPRALGRTRKRADARPLELSDLNFILRNGLRRHALRLDATPPADWGQRFSLRGKFTQSLLKRPGGVPALERRAVCRAAAGRPARAAPPRGPALPAQRGRRRRAGLGPDPRGPAGGRHARPGAACGGQSELSVSSNLQGLALDLPAPGRKEADAVLPLRLLMAPTGAGRDELRLEVGNGPVPLLQAQLQRDVSGASSQVLRGTLAVQDKLPALPASGVLLQVNVAALDLDAWQQRLGGLAGNGPANGAEADDAGLLPSQIALRSQALKIGGRQLGRASAMVARDGANWRINIDAEQIAGRIDLKGVRGSQIDAVQARLAKLSLPRQEVESVTELIDPGKADTGNGPLPSLDIQVDDFELRGKRLGRLEVLAQAPAAARDWKLQKLELQSPEATLHASGRWGGEAAAARRTQLDWKLDIADAGKLLERLGQGQVLRGGKGMLSGQVGWDGSP